jgi:hypothetical protein
MGEEIYSILNKMFPPALGVVGNILFESRRLLWGRKKLLVPNQGNENSVEQEIHAIP